jgi:hypothetical protein
MDRPLTRDDLKVDATTLKEENSIILFFNINVPLRIVQASQDTYYNTCLQIENFINDNFNVGESVYFQVTATYFIRNKKTGEEKLWGGSFSPRANSIAQLSPFQKYIRNNTFANIVVNASNNAEEKLKWVGKDTNWEFDRLESIIVNVQSSVNHGHETIERHSLLRQKHVTFELP